MNDISKLTDSILAKTHEEARNLIAVENEKIAKDILQAKKQGEIFFNSQVEDYKRLSEKKLEADISKRKSEIQKIKTRYRQDFLDKFFLEVEESLADISADEFITFYHENIKRLDLVGEYKLFIGDKSIVTLAPSEIKELNINGENYKVTVQNSSVIGKGGFLLEQDPVEYSFLFDDILNEIKFNSGAEILQKLLG